LLLFDIKGSAVGWAERSVPTILRQHDVVAAVTLLWRGRVGSHERSEMRDGVG